MAERDALMDDEALWEDIKSLIEQRIAQGFERWGVRTYAPFLLNAPSVWPRDGMHHRILSTPAIEIRGWDDVAPLMDDDDG